MVPTQMEMVEVYLMVNGQVLVDNFLMQDFFTAQIQEQFWMGLMLKQQLWVSIQKMAHGH